jgi:hypothetical protein
MPPNGKRQLLENEQLKMLGNFGQLNMRIPTELRATNQRLCETKCCRLVQHDERLVSYRFLIDFQKNSNLWVAHQGTACVFM